MDYIVLLNNFFRRIIRKELVGRFDDWKEAVALGRPGGDFFRG